MTRRSPATGGGCPCGTGLSYADCCGKFHSGAAVAPTAEKLMRSRYSAYAVNKAEYLRKTWHPDTAPQKLELDRTTRWTGLEILSTTRGSMFDTVGTVEFTAHLINGVGPDVLHENSSFVRHRGLWLYVSPVED